VWVHTLAMILKDWSVAACKVAAGKSENSSVNW
jgi:hypothetical protein